MRVQSRGPPVRIRYAPKCLALGQGRRSAAHLTHCISRPASCSCGYTWVSLSPHSRPCSASHFTHLPWAGRAHLAPDPATTGPSPSGEELIGDGVVDAEVGVAPLVLGDEAPVPHRLEVLEDGGPVGGLVGTAQELPDVVHPEGDVGVGAQLPDRGEDLGLPLGDQGVGGPPGDPALGPLRDHEVALLVEAQETGGGEVVDLHPGEAVDVLVGLGERGGDDVSHVVDPAVGGWWLEVVAGGLFPSPRLYYLNPPEGPLARSPEKRAPRGPCANASGGPLKYARGGYLGGYPKCA